MAARPHPVVVVLLVLTNLYVIGAGLYITFVGLEATVVEEDSTEERTQHARAPIGLLFAALGIATVLPLFFGRFDIPWLPHAALSLLSLMLVFSAGLFFLPVALIDTGLLVAVEWRTKALKQAMQPQ